MGRFLLFSFVFLSVLCLLPPKLVVALPLHTSSRWIVDEDGGRVKLACVNWPADKEAAVAGGLGHRPVGRISERIAAAGYNCVRLALPVLLAADESLASLTVRKSFQRLGLLDSLAGFEANNPSMLDTPLISAYQAVVSSLAENNLMVIIDSQLSSKPCFHGSGINPDLWVKGLTQLATMFSRVPNVVGMRLRNELRNVKDWYRYMQKGAEAVHSANPDVLVIISGLGDGTDLSFLLNQQLELTFTGKLVLEMHWHGSLAGKAQETGNPNKVCGRVVDSLMRRGGVLLQKGWPLMVVNELGAEDNRHLNCFFGLVAEMDFDWALGTLEETNGLMDLKHSSFFQRILALQDAGPNASGNKNHIVISHPLTNQCILRKSLYEPLLLGPCTQSEAWGYTPQKTFTVKGTYFCLQAVGLGKPAKLSVVCNLPGSNWEIGSGDSKMYLSTRLKDGTTVCLDADSSNHIVTNTCKCSSRDDMCDPGSQWFKIADISPYSPRHILQISLASSTWD